MTDPQSKLSQLSAAKRALLEKRLRGEAGGPAAGPQIPRREGRGPAPLSFAQQRLWFLDQMQPGLTAYNVGGAIRLRGNLCAAALREALDALCRRHDSLRTTFPVVDGEPVQSVAPAVPSGLPAVDLGALPEGLREEAWGDLTGRAARRVFDLARGPLLHCLLVRCAPEEHRLVVVLHHILADGWSLDVFVRDLAALYAALSRGEAPALPELPIQYADFAEWQRRWLQGPVLERQLAYWREQLAGAPAVLELPTDRPRPAVQTFRGASVRSAWPAGLLEHLAALGRSQGGTLFMALLAAFQELLRRYTGQEDLVVGTPIANRRLLELKGLIGFFVNTLALRADLSGDPTFRELLARSQAVALRAYDHQDLPFEKLVEELRPERSASHTPLFQVVFSLHNEPLRALELPGLTWSMLGIGSGTAKFDLTLSVEEGEGETLAEWSHNADLFDLSTVERLARHFRVLLEGVADRPDAPLSEIPLLTPEENRQILEEWNATAVPGEPGGCIHERFEAHAARFPERLAVSAGDTRLTYGELNRRANRLARELRARGVGPESVVAVCAERSPELVEAVLAVLKAGGAYLPLDPAYPEERLAWLLEDSGATIVLTRERFLGRLLARVPAGNRTILCLDTGRESWASRSAADVEPLAEPSNLAYVIYTSGSTGRPKGTEVPHAGLLNLVEWHRAAYAIAPTDRATLVAAPGFDASVWEVWPYLASGASLHVPEEEVRIAPARLAGWLGENRITLTFLPTPLAEAVLADGGLPAPSLRFLLTGGDRLHRRPAPGLGFDLVNHYGPTESSVVATAARVEPEGARRGAPSIGRPIRNCEAYVLDGDRRPVPVGVAGELCVGGASLARGYLRRPELTAERFIPHPFNGRSGERLYRTGDLVRLLPGGSLDFLGRIDHQVKLRGVRIELGEIEAALEEHPGVERAIVVLREDAPGDRRLVAYTVAPPAGHSGEDLRGFLARRLPEAMVPADFVLLESLPLTVHGKVDRSALPAPEPSRTGESEHVPPRTPMEELLAVIWREVLGRERVGAGDNFFHLGGHSLMATRVVSRIREVCGADLPLQTLFEAPTLAALACRIEAERLGGAAPAAPPLTAGPLEGLLPLSFAQERLWFLSQWEPGNPAYNLCLGLRLEGSLSVEALERSLRHIIERHAALRSTFTTRDGQPVQRVSPEPVFVLPVVNLDAGPRGEREAFAGRFLREEATRHFRLDEGPLLRASLVRLSEGEHRLLIVVHHIVSDGWSMSLLLEELVASYTAELEGREPLLPGLPVQYADFARWQRSWLQGEALERQLAWWREELAGTPEQLQLPTDRPRPAVQTLNGAEVSLDLPAGLADRLEELGRREGATLFMVLLAALETLFLRYSGQEDFSVGTPIAGRGRLETERLIGLFINTLALRARLDGDPAFTELLGRVRGTALGAYARQDLPFERLVEELRPSRDLSYTPIFQVMFALQNVPMPDVELPGLHTTPFGVDNGTSRYDLTLAAVRFGDGLRVVAEYSTDLFDTGTVRRLLGHFRTLLEGIAERPGERLSALPLLAGAERRQILEEWNDTAAPVPDRCIHELFEMQVERTSGGVALIAGGETLTWNELNRRANQIAHRLAELGAGPDSRVGICAERSADLVAALLGVLKAGAAYVPLDPAYPAERLAYMAGDAGLAALVTESHLLDLLPAGGAATVCLDRDRAALARQRDDDPQAGATPGNLAYVIYTSGSTGRPKGVMVTHRNAVNFFVGMDARVGYRPPGRWLAVTSISFDISVLELLWTLARGFQVVLQREKVDASSPAPAEPASEPAVAREVEMSLFFFSSYPGGAPEERYRLLLESARFADERGFAAIWTPERHFHDFGGLFPNPSVVSAALAASTRRLRIRAGSVVLPLHNPIRVAEEWAVVDNLSGGRAGISFASGWQPDDFVFAPESFASRKDVMVQGIETVRRLWRGETVTACGGAGQEVQVRTLPRPLQAELPVWLTAAGNPESFQLAGEMGLGVLTHLVEQGIEDLAGKIDLYRQAWRAAGHAGEGQVTAMVHAFVGEDLDAVRETVRGPFCEYLKSSLGLTRKLFQALGVKADLKELPPEDLDALLSHAFERYFETNALFGTPESCLGLVRRLQEIGVDEIACLVDFGVETETVLAALEYLDALRRRSAEPVQERDGSIPVQILRHGVTHLQCTPSLARMLLLDTEAGAALGSLENLLLGGEPLPGSLAGQLRERLGGRLLNMYGPTETTVWSATWPVEGEVEGTASLGRPIVNTAIYVVDRHLEPVPAGVPGELLIGGSGTVRGYLGRPDLTAERFVPDPFGGGAGRRLYRTGDMATFLPDGRLRFLGRIDHQVKVRGFRIELGEIEAVLRRHPAVQEAVAAVREDTPGDLRLVAYVTLREGEIGVDPSALREFAADRLPAYMVPSAFAVLPSLPLTPNGKVDRKALPAPDAVRAAGPAAAPRTPMEELLAGIWAEILKLDRVGTHDNFFELGGHSLLATQLVSRLRETCRVDLPLRRLFEAPTVAALAEAVTAAQLVGEGIAPAPPIEPAPQGDGAEAPLSFAQQRLWFIHQIEPGEAIYNDLVALHLAGPLDVSAVEASLNEIQRRHAALRTTFESRGGHPVQVVSPPSAVPLVRVDLGGEADPARQEDLLLALARQENLTPFDLERGPLWRVVLVRRGPEDHVLLLTIHHVIWDGWSQAVFLRELAALYQAFSAGGGSPLPEPAVQYADFARWQRGWMAGEVLERQLAYWRQQLQSMPRALELPTDRPRPLVRGFRGAQESLELPAALLREAESFSQREGATLFMTLLAVLKTLLFRYSLQGDVVVGSPIANRNRREIEDLVGFFVNMLVLRTDLRDDPTFRELLARVREVTLGAYAHQDLPFEKLVEELQPDRIITGHVPLVQVVFVMENVPMDRMELPGLTLRALDVHSGTSKFDLRLSALQGPAGLKLILEYSTELFHAETAHRMLRHFERLLRAAVEAPDTHLLALPLMTEEEWSDLRKTPARPAAAQVVRRRRTGRGTAVND